MAFSSGIMRYFGLALFALLIGCSGEVGEGEGDSEAVGSVSQATTLACSTPPLANECRYSPVQASASSVETSGSAHAAANAIDGSCTTRWSSAFGDPQWLKVDLGSSRPLSRVVIHWESAASSAYELQVSPDGNAWTKVATKSNATITGSGSTRVDTIAGLTASARYVRLYSTARTTAYGNSVFELEVFGTGCGPAPGCSQIPVFPLSAASSSLENADKGPEKAIDGLSSTRWSSAASDPQWLRLDLGQSQPISRVVLDWEAASSAKYEVQASDSSAGPWTVLGVHTDSRVGPRTDDVGGLIGSGRYLRIYSTKRATNFGNSLFEVRVFRESCDACEQTLTPSAVAASSTESSAFPATKAVDGDYGTRWSSAFSDPQWLRLDFGQERRIKDVIIKWEKSASSKNYRLEGSASANGPWTVLATRSNQAAGARIDTFEDLNGLARFLRVYSTARNGTYGNSIYEIIVVGGANSLACSYCAADDDLDGTLNCQDECPLDPAKITPGQCNCGVSDLDSDGDEVSNCLDECPLDAQTAYRGQCNCPHDAAPNGKSCNDGITPGTFACSNGVCGNPNGSSPPQAGCFVKTSGWHAYWFCPAATVAQATTRCAAVRGRKLIQIDTRQENTFAADFVTGESWIGAVDRTTEGEWSWINAAGQEKKKFWTGGASGKSYKGLFQSWLTGTPGADAAKDCGTLSSDRAWRAQSCSESRPYICEGVFGPGDTPGPGLPPHSVPGPGDIIPGWNESSNSGENGGGGGDGGGGSDVTEADCVPEAQTNEAAQYAQLAACDARCGEGAADPATEDECKVLCTEAAAPPPAGSHCSANGEPLSQLALLPANGVDACSVQNQDCSAVKYLGVVPTHCGVQMRCLDVTKDTGTWEAKSCAGGCRVGTFCDDSIGKCVNPALHFACDGTTQEAGICYGQCYGQIGCGIGGNALADSGAEPCSETRVCAPPYTAGLNPGSNLLDEAPWSDNVLPDLTASAPPPFSGDFATPCNQTPCGLCLGESANDPACLRLTRHSWCTYEQTTLGAPAANVNDAKSGERGSDSSIIKFAIDPNADLNFDLTPLPFGVSDFKVEAAASVRASASFNLGLIRGEIEIVDLRGALSASLCRASTKSSHIEVLGIDFLPKLLSAAPAAARKAIFDTDETWSGAAACEDAVAAYVDAVDRAKKALRDAQELISQFNTQKGLGHTFNAAFCTTVAGPGMRPPGMEGSCDVETPADTVNQFIKYYGKQANQIGVALDTLSKSVLNSTQLGQILGQVGGSGFAFYAPLGDPERGVGGKESATILQLNFLIGPVPCNLEVTSYLNYGLRGGFGANLEPSALISGGGTFAKAGAVIAPYADAGVTLFVGVGFDAGPFSLKLGIDGSVTLANIELPATAAAGLSMVPDKDDRPLPPDIVSMTNYEVLFPHTNLGPQKYNFQFDYSYGVNFTANNILSGQIDAALKIKFLFFSKKWSKRIISFDSGLHIGPINLIGGGSFDSTTKQHEDPVPEDVKTWKSSYGSVPFMGLTPVSMPANPVADASFDPERASELFYDSLCTCEANGNDCNRDADCCSGTASCFTDPGQGNRRICRECGQPDYTTTCGKEDDCCGDNVCNADPYEVCVTLPGCLGQGGTGGAQGTGGNHTGGTQPDLCLPNVQCTQHVPATAVCRPPPGGGGTGGRPPVL